MKKSAKSKTNQNASFLKRRNSTIGVLALAIVITLVASYGIIDQLERRAHSEAGKLVSEVVNHINEKIAEVEDATRIASAKVYTDLYNPEALEVLTYEFVEKSSFVYGSTVAFEPDVFPKRGRSFAPYSWKTADGQVHSRQLGTETDYYEEEWYAQTKITGEEYWCEPYFDEGGAKIMMCTFSIPLKDNDGNLVAVMTADIGLEELEEYIATITPNPDTYIILRSAKGTTLANADLDAATRDDMIIIKGMADIGWAVELTMPFTHLMRGDTGYYLFLLIGAILLISILFVYLINRLLNRIQQSAAVEYMNVIGALSGDFISVDFVELTKDKTNDKAKEYRVTEEFSEMLPEWVEEKSFSKKLNHLIDKLVYEPDKEIVFNETRREYVFGQLIGNDSFFVNFRLLYKGEIKYYQMKISAVRSGGRLSGIVAGLHSVDEQMKKEKQHQAMLQDALAKAKSASKAKSDFLFNMSHDIRTPMNAILGFTDVALRHLDDEERAKDSLKKIKSSGEHLLGLINDILEMSRVESGTLEITAHQTDIRDLIERVNNMGQALSIPKTIKFTTEIGELKNPYVYADELHYSEVLINLISNAVKYTDEDGKVNFKVTQLGEAANGKATFRFEVSDNGIGMSKDFQGHLFDAFSRERSSTVSKQQGTGLGLSIVKRIVDLSGGEIEVDSKLGEGTKMTVELPLHVMTDEEITKYKEIYNPNMASINEDFKLEGHKVLLVEDNELNREIAEMILTEAGLTVETAEDGDVAVKMVKKNGVYFYDYILMDIQMPVMNGYEATKAIRQMAGGDAVAIIAVSANAFEEDKKKSIEAGMNDHIAKPIDVSELLNSMRKLAR